MVHDGVVLSPHRNYHRRVALQAFAGVAGRFDADRESRDVEDLDRGRSAQITHITEAGAFARHRIGEPDPDVDVVGRRGAEQGVSLL